MRAAERRGGALWALAAVVLVSGPAWADHHGAAHMPGPATPIGAAAADEEGAARGAGGAGADAGQGERALRFGVDVPGSDRTYQGFGRDLLGGEAGSVWMSPVDTGHLTFGEDGGAKHGWQFGFHGYARMPLRTNGRLVRARSPYLVDDNYFLSGFAYTRIHETDWAELFLSAEKGKTRFVAGFFSSQFSDWSLTSLQGQAGIATAFVEHRWEKEDVVQVDVRAGMFWDRYGFVLPYDTYMFGRTHFAGLRVATRWFDTLWFKAGYGAHAEVVSSNQGFTPMAWMAAGLDLGIVDIGGYAFRAWTRDSEREFAIIENGSMIVAGGDARAAVPLWGPLYFAGSWIRARRVQFLSNVFEVLHSTGGRGLTENFFGPDSERGIGEILFWALDTTWQWRRWSRRALGTGQAASWLGGMDVRIFGMAAHVLSEQQSENPLENRHDVKMLKWGIEPLYRAPITALNPVFFAFRFDRVILDRDYESRSFRVVTPRVGVTPAPGLDIFLAYSRYWYGDNIRLRPNQIPGDLSVTQPDERVMKMQAQVRW